MILHIGYYKAQRVMLGSPYYMIWHVVGESWYSFYIRLWVGKFRFSAHYTVKHIFSITCNSSAIWVLHRFEEMLGVWQSVVIGRHHVHLMNLN